MVDMGILEEILEWTRRNNAVIDISFRDCSYRLRIDKMFRAIDRGGNLVSWSKAFGTKRPPDLFNTFVLEKITLRVGDKEESFQSLQALTRKIKG
ncbi:MAG: hypothetical protein ABWK01_02720 [Infirmifilum sp.]